MSACPRVSLSSLASFPTGSCRRRWTVARGRSQFKHNAVRLDRRVETRVCTRWMRRTIRDLWRKGEVWHPGRNGCIEATVCVQRWLLAGNVVIVSGVTEGLKPTTAISVEAGPGFHCRSSVGIYERIIGTARLCHDPRAAGKCRV